MGWPLKIKARRCCCISGSNPEQSIQIAEAKLLFAPAGVVLPDEAEDRRLAGVELPCRLLVSFHGTCGFVIFGIESDSIILFHFLYHQIQGDPCGRRQFLLTSDLKLHFSITGLTAREL